MSLNCRIYTSSTVVWGHPIPYLIKSSPVHIWYTNHILWLLLSLFCCLPCRTWRNPALPRSLCLLILWAGRPVWCAVPPAPACPCPSRSLSEDLCPGSTDQCLLSHILPGDPTHLTHASSSTTTSLPSNVYMAATHPLVYMYMEEELELSLFRKCAHFHFIDDYLELFGVVYSRNTVCWYHCAP